METIALEKQLFSAALIDIHQASIGIGQTLPIFTSYIQASHLSPACGYVEKSLDINDLIIQRPAATFYVNMQDDSMQKAGIFSGDILVVDRSLTAYNNNIIVAVLDGEFTVKRLIIEEDGIYLFAENLAHSSIKIGVESRFEVWGVVTYVVHKTR